jgi:hypothetical protein
MGWEGVGWGIRGLREKKREEGLLIGGVGSLLG